MGKGLAQVFRDNVPGLYEYYRNRYGTSEEGWQQRIYQVELFTIRPDKKVLLIPTKGLWRQPAILSAIETNLSIVAEHYERMGIDSLGIPMLGCGVETGQLNWERDVEPIVHGILGPIPLPVKVLMG